MLIEGFISDINSWIESWLNLKEEDFIYGEDVNEVIEKLDIFFKSWEVKIEEEHKKNYVTDDVENRFKFFAEICAQIIVKYENVFLNSDRNKFKKFLKHRHMGYGFYISYDKTKEFLKNTDYKKILYMSLACYYQKFYGKFSDNEQAIEMLCKYYPKDIRISLTEKKRISKALFNHCTNAGSAGDVGFAYNGITEIKEGFKNLPNYVIEHVLYLYQFHHLDRPINRRQIYTIINSINFTQKYKDRLKFFFMDSALLISELIRIFYQKYRKDYMDITVNNITFISCNNNDITVLTSEEVDLICSWVKDGDRIRKRILKKVSKKDNKEEIIAEVGLGYDKNKKYVVTVNNNKQKKFELKFQYDNYSLNDFFSNNMIYERLLEFFGQQDIEYNNSMVFSHIWIDNYRGIHNQQLSFDHKFNLEINDDAKNLSNEKNNITYEIKKEDNKFLQQVLFGNSVYSVSAIVGQNGTGKTSIISFLQDEFFDLISLIESGHIEIKEGKVEIEDGIEEEIGESDICSFIVIFFFENKPYYITNLENLIYKEDEILPYKPHPYKNIHENSKVIYFSNMINPDVRGIGGLKNYNENIFLKSIKFKNMDKEKKKEILKDFDSEVGRDFSENKSFIANFAELNRQVAIRKEELENKDSIDEGVLRNNNKEDYLMKNKDFWYQAAFFDAHNSENFNKWFDGRLSKNDLKIEVLDKKINLVEKSINYKDINTEGKNDVKEKTIEDIFNTIKEDKNNLFSSCTFRFKHFSAGQYAKFTFLSKLYWYLNGYEKYHKRIEEEVGSNNLFEGKDSVLENSTSIIFIDEGELYYHPEWQRTYIYIT